MRKKDGSLVAHTINAIENSKYTRHGAGYKIHYAFWAGSNRHRRLVSYKDRLLSILKERSFKVVHGNDAPRGGAEGDYLLVSKRAIKYLNSLIKAIE